MGITRRMLRWGVTGFFVLVIAPIITANVERLAAERGWDRILVAMSDGSLFSTLAQIGQHVGLWLTATFLLGAMLALWVNELLPRAAAQSNPLPETEADIRPHYAAWDHVEEFELWQAACLWEGIEPASEQIDNSKVYAWLRMLKDAIRRHELHGEFTLDQAISLKRGHHIVNQRTRVKRGELKAFAEKKGMAPRFLFPEDQ